MTLTLNQCTERAGRLSGELKAARELRSICADDLVAKEREATLARQALENAEANITRLETERAELAEEAKLAILAKGEPLEVELPGGSVSEQSEAFAGENNFISPLYTNGEARLNSVFDEATQP